MYVHIQPDILTPCHLKSPPVDVRRLQAEGHRGEIMHREDGEGLEPEPWSMIKPWLIMAKNGQEWSILFDSA